MENKNEFDYVFEACKGKIHPAAIADLLSVPEFVDELRKFDGQMDNVALSMLAERVYSKVKAVRYDDEFKHSYIEKNGMDEWKNYKKRLGLLENGYRKARRSL